MKPHCSKIPHFAFCVLLLISFVGGYFLGGSRTNLFQERRMSQSAKQRTLVSILDAAKFENFNIEAEDFSNSCFIVEAMLREKLPETLVPDGLNVASNLRVLVGTYREGKKAFDCEKGATAREVLRQFASLWDVAALLDGNVIVFAEVFDQSHFKYEVALNNSDNP
jgi:hypothetical protein